MQQYIWWPGLAVTAAMVVIYGILWLVEQIERNRLG